MLPDTHLMDQLATSYVDAVAAISGATIAVSRLDYGIDGTLQGVRRLPNGRFVPSDFPVQFQLKATVNWSVSNEILTYDLKGRNYDLITCRSPRAAPYYLFLVCLPHERANWTDWSPELFSIRAHAYWWRGSADTESGKTSVRIHIPTAQRLTERGLRDMCRYEL